LTSGYPYSDSCIRHLWANICHDVVATGPSQLLSVVCRRKTHSRLLFVHAKQFEANLF